MGGQLDGEADKKMFYSPVLLVFVEVESSVVVAVAVLKVGERFAAAEFLPEKNSINLLFSCSSIKLVTHSTTNLPDVTKLVTL